MFKFTNITDFFKPSGQPRPNKRPPPDDDDDEKTRLARRSRSNTPRGTDRKLQTNTGKEVFARDAAQGPQASEGHLNGSILPSQSPRRESTNNISIASIGTRREHIEPLAPLDPVLTSSQRVVINGEVMIRNSDDESESSLDDIDDLLTRKSAMIPSPQKEPEAVLPPSAKQRDLHSGSSTRSRTRGARPALARRSPSSLPQPPRYEFSLDSLEQRSNDDRASEADAAKARTLLDSFENPKGPAQNDFSNQVKTGAKVDATLLASVMKNGGEEEDIDRLMTAITRTEAFHQGKSWSFFDDLHRSSSAELAKVPIPQVQQWQGILNDRMSRQQAFLGGYVGDMASKGSVPDEILLWVLDAVCFETRDDLRSSYIYTLEEAHDRITTLLTPTLIDSLLHNIGASTEAVDIRRAINPAAILLPDKQDRDQSKLLSVLNLISRVSGHLSVSSRTHAICILCRLSLDITVVKNCEINAAIEKAFSSLVDRIPEEDIDQELRALSAIIYLSVQDSALRLQMLQNIPAFSSRLSFLRRRLSMAFFFEDETFLRRDDKDLIDMKLIAHHLRKPRFKIRNDMDYPELAALIAILSIGIESGDRPPAESDKQELATFNADVDLLTSRIYEKFTHIVDTGASHMKRTQAKEVLEAFQSQLSYAIRTKPKAKKGLFDESTAERTMMKEYLERGPVVK